MQIKKKFEKKGEGRGYIHLEWSIKSENIQKNFRKFSDQISTFWGFFGFDVAKKV